MTAVVQPTAMIETAGSAAAVTGSGATVSVAGATDPVTSSAIAAPAGAAADLVAWVREVAALTGPERVVWTAGSEAEWAELTERLVAAGTFTRLEAKENSFYTRLRPDRRRPGRGPHLHLLGGRGRRRPDEQLDGPGRDEGDHDRVCTRARMRGRTMYVVPFCMGPLDARDAEARRRDHRLRVRRRLDAGDDPDGHRGPGADQHRAALGQGAALGRCAAGARRAGRAVAVQRHQVHLAVPRGADDLVVRLRLRRKRACWARSATRCGSPR